MSDFNKRADMFAASMSKLSRADFCALPARDYRMYDEPTYLRKPPPKFERKQVKREPVSFFIRQAA